MIMNLPSHTWMRSLIHFFDACFGAMFHILHSDCCALRVEYYEAGIACIHDLPACEPTDGQLHIMPRLWEDVWLNFCIWSTPAQWLFARNGALCVAGREQISSYCCAASEHVHHSIRAPTGQAHARYRTIMTYFAYLNRWSVNCILKHSQKRI